MRIPGGSDAPRRARTSVLARLDGQVGPTRAMDAALIVSELVTNSVLHANVGQDRSLTVELVATEDRLRITVTDPGSRLEPSMLPRDPKTPGHYGLNLVDTLSVAWGVVREAIGTTSVWCELPLDRVPLNGVPNVTAQV
jgi:anti-sigma regulatory factor (Ser/Thr protein kinase)